MQIRRLQHPEGRLRIAWPTPMIIVHAVGHHLRITAGVGHRKGERHRSSGRHGPVPGDHASLHLGTRWLFAPARKLHAQRQSVGQYHSQGSPISAVAQNDGVGHRTVVHYTLRRRHRLGNRQLRLNDLHSYVALVVGGVGIQDSGSDLGCVGETHPFDEALTYHPTDGYHTAIARP